MKTQLTTRAKSPPHHRSQWQSPTSHDRRFPNQSLSKLWECFSSSLQPVPALGWLWTLFQPSSLLPPSPTRCRRTDGNRHKLQQGKFSLGTKNKFVTVTAAERWKRSPQEKGLPVLGRISNCTGQACVQPCLPFKLKRRSDQMTSRGRSQFHSLFCFISCLLRGLRLLQQLSATQDDFPPARIQSWKQSPRQQPAKRWLP